MALIRFVGNDMMLRVNETVEEIDKMLHTKRPAYPDRAEAPSLMLTLHEGPRTNAPAVRVNFTNVLYYR